MIGDAAIRACRIARDGAVDDTLVLSGPRRTTYDPVTLARPEDDPRAGPGVVREAPWAAAGITAVTYCRREPTGLRCVIGIPRKGMPPARNDGEFSQGRGY